MRAHHLNAPVFPTNLPSSTNGVSQGSRSAGPSFSTVLAQTTTRSDEASSLQWRNELLARLGQTQAKLAAMSPQDRKVLEKKLTDLMRKSSSAGQRRVDDRDENDRPKG
jgi:hypothetical protein